MKKIFLSVLFLVLTISPTLAQSPHGFKYQAVARDASNQPLVNQTIDIRIQILNGSSTGSAAYTELHRPTTTDLGIFSITIGQGAIFTGDFSNIDWANNEYWLQVEMDVTGSSNYILMGASQLLSVPYALHAESVSNSDDADADPNNEIQQLSKNGSLITLSQNGGTFNDEVDDADADPNNEIQSLGFNAATNVLSLSNGGNVDLSSLDNDGGGTGTGTDDQVLALNGTVLSIEDGNSVDLSPIQDGVTDADANPINEIQSLTKSGNQISLSRGGGTITDEVNDADNNPNNEFQTISKSGDLVTLSNNGGTFIDEVDDADADANNEIQSLTKQGNQILLSNGGGSVQDEVNDADADPINEIQDLALTGNNLSLTQSNAVDLSPFASPWTEENIGIRYENGKVSVWDPTEPSKLVRLFNNAVLVSNENDYDAYLFANQLKFQNLQRQPSLVTDFGYGGMDIYEPGVPAISRAKFTKDSLYQYAPPVGLLWASKTRLVPGGLTLNNGIETSRLDFLGLHHSVENTGDLYLSMREGLTIEEEYPQHGRFRRLSLTPDNLEMVTSNKQKVVELGREINNGAGNLSLYHDDGLGEIAKLYSNKNAAGGGELLLSFEGAPRAFLTTEWGHGAMGLFDEGNANTVCATANNLMGGGDICVNDSAELTQVRIWVTRDSAEFWLPGEDPKVSLGHIYSTGDIFSPLIQTVQDNIIWNEMNPWGITTENGFQIEKIRRFKDDNSGGWLLSDPSVELFTGLDDNGMATFFGKNSTLNVAITGNYGGSGNQYGPNSGAVIVYDSDGNMQAGIEANPQTGQGEVWADQFITRKPAANRSNTDIVYGVLQGAESAAYLRGTAQLTNGRAFISYPDHFKASANTSSATIILTPLSSKTYGLAAIEKTNDGFWVEELMNGQGDFNFDWEVKCVRIGQEDFEVYRSSLKPKNFDKADNPVQPSQAKTYQESGCRK